MLNSRFMSAGPTTEEYRTLVGDLEMLKQALKGSLPGIENLRITYCQDYSTIAQLDLLLSKVSNLVNKISEYVPDAPDNEVIVADYKDDQSFAG
jgi:hypothetical protein